MDDQVFYFRHSRMAAGIFIAAYAGTTYLVLLAMPPVIGYLLAGGLLPCLAINDAYRCGFLGRRCMPAMRLRQQGWQLCFDGTWRTVDLAVYYRGEICIIVAWREPGSRRVRNFVVWRDMLPPARWRLLAVYLRLVPLTLVDKQ